MTSMYSKTERAQPELPPELTDRIIDFLHDEPKTLAACSLVARSWTIASRYHLFSMVVLINPERRAKFERLIQISPTMIQYIRGVFIDVDGIYSTRWISVCARFTSLQHIMMNGVVAPPWRSEAAVISRVARNITSFTLSLAIVHRDDVWPIIRTFPNLVSLAYVGAKSVPASAQPLQSSFPSHTPQISSISVTTSASWDVLEALADPPYPLISLSNLNIQYAYPGQGRGLQALAQAYGSQISRLRLQILGRSPRCTSSHPSQPPPSC